MKGAAWSDFADLRRSHLGDIYPRAKRSEVMGRVKARDTTPEVKVRRLLHRLGYRFRLHSGDLPGSPDIVLPRYRAVILVHGCFWHGHECPKGRRPASNTVFWDAKLTRNVERDAENSAALEELGWRPIIVWECELRRMADLEERLKTELPKLPPISPASKASAEPGG